MAVIVENRKAWHDYFIEERLEAGMVLQGWEIKAIRSGRAHLKEAYVKVMGDEVVLLGCHITPLASASTHVHPDPTRTRKLLLHQGEIKKLIGKAQRQGYTLVPLNLHWSRGKVKCEIGLGKGKKLYDKRHAEAERDWQRQKAREMAEK